MRKESKIYVAGHTGMVGSAITRKLKEKGYENIICRTVEELDLTNQQAVSEFFNKEKPEYVILAAARVGGIHANNTYRAQFIYDNLMIQNNVIHHSYLNGVNKLLFLGSSCIYPKNAPQPLKEEYLLTGELEQTNEPYAIAKIAGIKMCESYNRQYGCNFISVMPTNLYGPNDNYNLETSHVLPAIIRKIHLGKCLENNDWTAIRYDLKKRPVKGIIEDLSEESILTLLGEYGICRTIIDNRSTVTVTLWGTGQVFREFMYVDDMAAACLYVMENIEISSLSKIENSGRGDSKPFSSFLNIGTGIDQTIRELSLIIKEITGYNGTIAFDNTKPDGTYKKLLDVSMLNGLGFNPEFSLEAGIKSVYEGYIL
jgi:GDP-L-fucose synthase